MKLEDALERVIDHRGRTPTKLGGDFAQAGVPVISARNIIGSRLALDEETRFVTPSMWDEWMPIKLDVEDVLLTSEAPLGERAYLSPEVGSEFCLGQRLFALRTRKDILYPRYLYYALGTAPLRERILARATGTTAQGIRQSELLRIEVDLPDIGTQIAIAEALGSLDDKIDMNRRTCSTLDAIVRATFQSWFVDFEPVKAKASGESPDSICRRLGLTREVLDLFPSAFASSGIPSGWKEEQLARLADLETSGAKPLEQPAATWEHYSIPAFDEGGLPTFELGKSIKSNKFRVHENSVLVSKLNPQFPRTWLPMVSDRERAVCSTEFMQLVVNEPADRAFLYGLATSESFQRAMAERVTGTTGSRQRVGPPALMAMPVITPACNVRRAFGSLTMDSLGQCAKLREVSAVIARTRDAMLGPLMSGELSVSSVGEA